MQTFTAKYCNVKLIIVLALPLNQFRNFIANCSSTWNPDCFGLISSPPPTFVISCASLARFSRIQKTSSSWRSKPKGRRGNNGINYSETFQPEAFCERATFIKNQRRGWSGGGQKHLMIFFPPTSNDIPMDSYFPPRRVRLLSFGVAAKGQANGSDPRHRDSDVLWRFILFWFSRWRVAN